jgi:hypothetical protein
MGAPRFGEGCKAQPYPQDLRVFPTLQTSQSEDAHAAQNLFGIASNRDAGGSQACDRFGAARAALGCGLRSLPGELKPQFGRPVIFQALDPSSFQMSRSMAYPPQQRSDQSLTRSLPSVCSRSAVFNTLP